MSAQIPGERLLLAFRQLGKTQKDIADEMGGKDKSTVNRWTLWKDDDIGKIQKVILQELQDKYKINSDYIISGVGPKLLNGKGGNNVKSKVADPVETKDRLLELYEKLEKAREGNDTELAKQVRELTKKIADLEKKIEEMDKQ